MKTLDSGRLGLLILTIFTLVAIVGYWAFGVHPENLARFPQAATFYANSFAFFAQSHIVLSAIVLFIILRKASSFAWIWSLLAVYVLSLFSELLGTMTGFPFGDYTYTHLLGIKWANHVPVLIPLSWFTMAFPAYILVERLLKDSVPVGIRWAISALLLTSWDLVLDPAMSFLVPYWIWGTEGAFFGMPWVNLFGWFLTGYVLSVAMHFLRAVDSVPAVESRYLAAYYAIVFSLPAGMLLVAGYGLLSLAVSFAIALAWALCVWIGPGGNRKLPERVTQGERGPESGSSYEFTSAEFGSLQGHLGRIAGKTDLYFEQHSRSFSYASALFLPSDRARVCGLYAFCRMTDDIADEPGLDTETRSRLLGEWLEIVHRSYDGSDSNIEWLDALMRDLKNHGLPFKIIDDLVAGVRSDLDRTSIQTQSELAHYSYQVASTVGIMMCYLFEETDEWILDRAASLGLAMQLTNIYRDVGKDLSMGRVYIPEDWLKAHNVRHFSNALNSPSEVVSESYVALMTHLEMFADQEYEKAWKAIPKLSWRFGPSVAAAAMVYRAIHGRIRKNEFDNLTRRAYTSQTQKLGLVLVSLLRFVSGKVLLHTKRMVPSRFRTTARAILQRNNMSWMIPYVSVYPIGSATITYLVGL